MHLFLTVTQLLASQDVNWWTGVVLITCGLLWCFYQLFGLSFWRHPFTAEDHCWANYVMLHFSKSDEDSHTSWMAFWTKFWSKFSAMFHFGVSYSFKTAYRVTFNLMLPPDSLVCVWMSWWTLDAKVCRWHRWHLVGRCPNAEGIDRTCLCVCVCVCVCVALWLCQGYIFTFSLCKQDHSMIITQIMSVCVSVFVQKMKVSFIKMFFVYLVTFRILLWADWPLGSTDLSWLDNHRYEL